MSSDIRHVAVLLGMKTNPYIVTLGRQGVNQQNCAADLCKQYNFQSELLDSPKTFRLY